MIFTISIRSVDRTVAEIGNFELADNKITFLFGESGIGKSLLSKSIYGLLNPKELSIEVNGKSYSDYLGTDHVKALKKNSFFVFQEPSSHLNPLEKLSKQLNEGSLNFSVGEEQILETLWNSKSDQSIKDILSIYPKPYRPSGGEKQRILLAMAFKKIRLWIENKTETESFFVFDEPTGSLDNRYRNLFLSLLFDMYSQKKFTANLITHDYSIISEVVGKYPQLKDSVDFKELVSDNGKLKLETFNHETYLNWIKSENAGKKFSSFQSESLKQEILRLESKLTVFNRNLTIYSDRNYKTPSPLVINQGEMVYLKAPSGIGKTTVAKVVMGLYQSTDFKMAIHGTAFNQNTPHSVWRDQFWGTRIGMVFQHADESLNMNSTVRDSFKGLPSKTKLTDKFLSDFLNPFFGNRADDRFLKTKIKFLSGGQKQRINLLRSMISNPEFLVLDEPLNGLDFKTMLLVLDLIRKMQENGTGILLISHNEEIFDSLIPEKNIYYLNAEE